jgi:hypothetical protein
MRELIPSAAIPNPCLFQEMLQPLDPDGDTPPGCLSVMKRQPGGSYRGAAGLGHGRCLGATIINDFTRLACRFGGVRAKGK